MSFNAAALKLMAQKGLSAHDIAAIAEANEKSGDSAAERRRAWDRARKAEKRDAAKAPSGGMSGGNPPDPSPNERDILTPTHEKPEPNGSVKKRADKGFRLPIDWTPKPLVGKAQQMASCWQAGELERELAKFKNYWLAKGSNATRTDWQRTWVNWLISADERKPRHGNSIGTDSLTALALQRIGALQH